jgi:hypothetical protein
VFGLRNQIFESALLGAPCCLHRRIQCDPISRVTLVSSELEPDVSFGVLV